MLYTSLLGTHLRRRFDPAKDEDIRELAYFLKYNKWKNGCPFYLEFAWNNIPAMCKEAYCKYVLENSTKE